MLHLLAASSDSGVNTTVFAAFGVGFLSFVSPCVLPLVPGYLSAVSGVSYAEMESGQSRWRVLGPAQQFWLSFTAMFVALGMTDTGLGQSGWGARGPAVVRCLSLTAMFVAVGTTATGLGQTLQERCLLMRP